MKRQHYRTPNRKLILSTINGKQLSVKLIHLNLKRMFEAGELNLLPAINQIYRTISDLKKGGYVTATKGYGVNYYSRRM
jgi:hypothetical protein